MSAGAALDAQTARVVAESICGRLAPACERIEIAGSLRRRRATVHDIEIVVIPKTDTADGGDLWGTPVEVDLLESALQAMRISGELRLRDVEIHRKDGSTEIGHRDGDSYKALECQGIPLDLFIVRPPADWGVIFAIRTGPGDWNQRIVTDCQRFLRRVEGGRVYRSGQYVRCPEERDFFAAVGQPWVEPEQRSIERVQIQARAA